MDISILRLTDDLIRNSGLDNATKKVLYANIGRYIAAEDTERGWVFFLKTLADNEKGAIAKWGK
ncbi:MAG: hypothetical protein ACKV1O_00605 [Saprospiraceae bacterium]